MQKSLPYSLEHDAWWLAASLPEPAPAPRQSRGPLSAQGFPAGVPVLPALILLADLLFWEQPPGLSLALFALAVFAAVLVGTPRARLLPAALVLLVGILPVIEFVQALSVAFLVAALALALVLVRGVAATDLAPAALRLVAGLPLGGLISALRALPRLRQAGSASSFRRLLATWAFPLGGTLVLAALLVGANPVLAAWLDPNLDLARLIRRGLFWAGIALLLLPLLAPPDTRPLTMRARLPHLGINAASTGRALWMFNALIGVQTLLDASILLWGAALPQGMTHAEYAHRGAYPLLATALLAGAFALAANPFLAERRGLRPLMLLWLAQNVALCLSALLRLDLYVQAYGLTYLRVHAAIWMALVAGGLALTLVQTWAARPTRWLLPRVALWGAGTLYLCCFVNFAGLIADYNLRRGLDIPYVCTLGPQAAPALAAARAAQGPLQPWWYCDIAPPEIRGWRDWGFRNWRIGRKSEPAEVLR